MATQMSWQLRQRTPSPEARASNSHPKARTPRPDAYRPRGGSSSSASSSNLNLCMDEGASSPSPSPSRTRTLSRTQLRHATAARRLSAEGIVSNGGSAGGRRAKDAPVMNENLFPSDSGPQAGPSSSSQTPRRNGYGVTKDNNNTQNPQRPKLKRRPGSVTASEIIFALATGTDPSLSSATRPSAADQEIYRAIAQKADARKRESCADGSNERERSAPLLPKTLHAVGVNLMIDSTNLQTLALAQPILKATYMTPGTVLDMISLNDNYCHMWLAVEETLQRIPPGVSLKDPEHMDFAVKQALPKFIAEISHAVNDCGTHNEGPHYAFLDPRIFDAPDMNDVVAFAVDQATTVTMILMEKGLKRDQIYFNIPANEGGLRVARALKSKLSVQSNLVFVSNLLQAWACASVGAASVTVPVAKIVQREEKANPFCHKKASSVAYESVQAISCYMKRHGLSTKVIGTDLRELSDIKYLACLDGIALREADVERAKWMPLRVDKPPQEGSPAMVRAANTQAPLPFPQPDSGPTSESDEPFHFLAKMSSKSKHETNAILEEGLSAWKGAMHTIEDVLRAEFDHRLFIRREPKGLERTDTEPLEEEYTGELIGFPVFLSARRESSPGPSDLRSDSERERESSRGRARSSERRGRTPSKHKRSLSRCSTLVDFPATGDDAMENEGPRPSDEMLLRSPMVRSKDSFDSDSDSDSEEDFLV